MQILFPLQPPEQEPLFTMFVLPYPVGEIYLGQDGRQLPVAWIVVVQTARIANKKKMDLFMVNFVVYECEYESE